MRITASVLVCCAAAGVAVGALTLDPIRREPPRPAAVSPTTAPSGPRAARRTADVAPATMTIEGFRFGTVHAAPGATVAVTNRDPADHTVTASDGSFDTGTVPAGGQGSFVAPAAPGTYRFVCQIHPGMTGTLIVG